MTFAHDIDAARPAFPDARVLLVAAHDDVLHAHTRLRQRALERLGCTVKTFNLLGDGGWLARWRRAGTPDRLARALARHAPAIVLVFGNRRLDRAAVAALRHHGDAVWINWSSESCRSVEPMRELTASYDAVFVGSTAMATHLAGAGQAVRYLPPGCDPSVHRPLRSRGRFRANVVFAGSATPYREQVLSELAEFGLAVWGPGWRRTKLRDYCRGEALDHGDYVRAYAGASVAVDVPWDDGPAPEVGCTRRVFELAAIGVPQVNFGCRDVAGHFDSQREVPTCGTAADLKGLTAELLHDRPWAEELAGAARRRAIGEHTYVHRMRSLLDAVRGLDAARGEAGELRLGTAGPN